MTDHMLRILRKIFDEIKQFENEIINEKILIRNLEACISAIEEDDIKNILNNFVTKIEESLYLFGEAAGKKFLKKEILKLKGSFAQYMQNSNE